MQKYIGNPLKSVLSNLNLESYAPSMSDQQDLSTENAIRAKLNLNDNVVYDGSCSLHPYLNAIFYDNE